MAFIKLDELTLHYSLRGPAHAPVLVFINSLGSDWRIWDKVADAFVPSYRVLRYDKRGHGLSDAPPAPYAMRDHAADLLSLLSYLHIDQAVLIGISVGGMIAQEVALWQPQRVAGLVLCDTGARIGTEQSWNERIEAVNQHGLEAIADAVLNRWFTPNFDEAARAGWRNMLVRTPVPGYAGTCAALRDCDLRTRVGEISQPTLVLCGATDTSTPPELNRALAAAIPGAQYVEIAKAAHLPCLEQPATMVNAIAPFVSKTIQQWDSGTVFERGMAVRRAVLGDAHVDRAEANKTDFDADFQRYITEMAWGSMWARDGLERKTRHLITIALLAALGKEHELAMHIRATKNTGVTKDEVKEVLLQVAVYAGVPSANSAFAVTKRVYAEEQWDSETVGQ
jgi:3-oxoadipate enol-lactonase/4-carboxymuconolactone decarboxylase